MTKQISRRLSPAREKRYFQRAKLLSSTDPFYALDYVHKLLDGEVCTSEAHQLEATLLLQLGCGTFAAKATERALKAGGDPLPLLLLLLKCHLSAYNRKPAAIILERLLEFGALPDQAKAEIAHGAQEIHQYDVAERLYLELLESDPRNCKYLINLGYAYQKNGNMQEAERCYRSAIEQKPDSANALRLLSSVRKQTSDDNCRKLISDAMPDLDKASEEYVTAAYALGKTCEDLGEYESAFENFKAGADAMHPKLPYSTSAVKRTFEITKTYFDHPQRQHAVSKSSAVHSTDESLKVQPRQEPLFILGMPRTGSTLIDRILCSHSEATSMGELGCFKEAMKVVTGYGGGEGFHEHFYSTVDREIDLPKLGATYIEAASPTDFSGRFFIDKYPMNFMDLGLIADTLPRARFIHTLRTPLDTVFANFKQLFTLGFYHYSYSIAECAEYYLQYQELMAYWKQRLPGRILDVQYEDLVNNTEPQIRRILDFLDLDWQADCLAFYNNSKPVDTASLSQVRQPIYKSAIGHWRHYEAFLSEAITIFNAAGVNIDTDIAGNGSSRHER